MNLKGFHKGVMFAAASLFAIIAVKAPAQTLQGAGATFPYPIYKEWFAQFQKSTNIGVNYQSVGSGKGYTSFKAKTVDFGASDAPLTDEEERSLSAPAVHIATVGGADVLAYNIPGQGVGLRLTADIVAGIFLGKIVKWNDPKIVKENPKANLPDLAIQSVHRTDGSGTTYIFTSYLKKVSAEWAAGPGAGKSVNWPTGLGGNGNQGVSGVIQRTPGSIGYIELAYAMKQNIPYASLKNRSGAFITASVDTVTNAINGATNELKKNIKTPIVDAPGKNSYSISSLTFILIYKAPHANNGNITKLWDWALEKNQQEFAKTLGYAPLPKSLVALNKTILKNIPGTSVH
ncbi:phosphate-binding protein [Armatimonadota bacterium]|nr:phosphate-binding protein [Armatimonadota bacterium]